MKNWWRWPLNAVIGLLVVIGVTASATFYMREPYNPRFGEIPLIVALHVTLGGLFLALAPFQFVQRIRQRWPQFHRWNGRFLVGIGLVVGVNGLLLAWLIPFSGWSERIVLGFFGILFLAALVQGFLHIRARRVKLHRVWMMRAFALGLAIATQRLILIPLIIFAGMSAPQAALLNVPTFAVGFVLNALMAELLIRRLDASKARHQRTSQAGPLHHA